MSSLPLQDTRTTGFDPNEYGPDPASGVIAVPVKTFWQISELFSDKDEPDAGRAWQNATDAIKGAFATEELEGKELNKIRNSVITAFNNIGEKIATANSEGAVMINVDVQEQEALTQYAQQVWEAARICFGNKERVADAETTGQKLLSVYNRLCFARHMKWRPVA